MAWPGHLTRVTDAGIYWGFFIHYASYFTGMDSFDAWDINRIYYIFPTLETLPDLTLCISSSSCFDCLSVSFILYGIYMTYIYIYRKCIYAIYVTYIMYVWHMYRSPPSSWHCTAETLVASWVIEVSFVLMRWLWVGFWMRADHWKNQAMIRSLEFSALLHPPERIMGVEMELVIDHATWGSLSKNLNNTRFWELPGGWTSPWTGRGICPNSVGTEAPTLGTLPNPTLCISSSGLMNL